MKHPDDDGGQETAIGAAEQDTAPVRGDDTATGPLSPGAPPTGLPSLVPGQVLSGRYRVARFIARGGMGEVYEALDLELGEAVAIKTIRPERAGDEHAEARFRREILLSRKVTHPNVCRIYDAFRHGALADGASGPSEIFYLTMELLNGETLAQRLRRVGRYRTSEALPIVAQMASALDAAHRAGIVHRDFKSGNVMLVAAVDGGSAPRVVVTDFGLARALAVSEQGSGSTTGGIVTGTSAYMAPEQVEDGDITGSADIYALGIVMYEMVTGRLPFVGSSPLSTAVMRLRERPAPPRVHVPDLDERWQEAILRCLEASPGERFERAEEVLEALGGRGRPRRRRRTAALAGAAVLLALAAGTAVVVSRASRPAAPQPGTAAAARASRRAVAVLTLKNLSGRPDVAWLADALSEMLRTELAAGERLRVIPGENVSRMRVELALPNEDSLAPDTLSRIRANLGTDLVVLGSYLALGQGADGRIRVDVRLQDARSGETLDTVTETGREADLLDLVGQLGVRLRGAMGAPGITAADAGGVQASLPSTAQAARLYSDGLAQLRRFDALAARDLLQQAADADPNHPLVHAALAQAWSTLGYDARAAGEARRALDLGASLPREPRLLVEGRFHENTGDWTRAVEVYRTLFGFFPDSVDYGLRLASAQVEAARAADALQTVAALRRLPAPASQDARIDLAEADAAGALSDYRRLQSSSSAAIEKGRASGARLVVAQAQIWLGWALWNLGKPADATASYELARDAFSAAGDTAGMSRALRGLANVRSSQGDIGGALALFEEALAAYRQIGNRGGEAVSLTSVGNVLHKKGDLKGALAAYEQSLTIRREIGDRTGEAAPLGSMATVLLEQGNLVRARELLDQALLLKRELGERIGVAQTLNQIGEVQLAGGDVAGARAHFEQSSAVAAETGNRRSAAYSAFSLGRLVLAHGDVAAAEAHHREALAVRQALGELGNVALSRLALSCVALESGRPAEAQRDAEAAAHEFREEGRTIDEASALAAVARALLAQGLLPQAEESVRRAQGLLAPSGSQAARIDAAITAARIGAAAGRPAEAARLLDAAVTGATRTGLRPLALEARLALGQLELRAGRGAKVLEGRARVEAVKAEAGQLGLGLLARRAEAVLSGSP